MKTYSTKAKDVERKWHVIDASGKTLGRLCTQIASLLLGKHNPTYCRILIPAIMSLCSTPPRLELPGRKPSRKPTTGTRDTPAA